MKRKLNAKDLLLELMQADGWHGIVGDRNAQIQAGTDKKRLQQGKLSYDKCVEWLKKLGWKKVQEETWSN